MPNAVPSRRVQPTRPARALLARRGERGVSIVLAMLVLFVLLVVVFQVDKLSWMELDKASYQVDSVRNRWLADACSKQAVSSLLMDLEEAEEDEEGGGGEGGGEEGPLGGLGGGGLEESLEDTAAGVTSTTDSLLDEWKNPPALAPAMGEDLELFVEVVDEDSKVNLLGLWTEDEGKRAEWREVFVRLLDKSFEGTSFDVTIIDAEDLLDRLDEWVAGRRGTFERLPLPPLKKSRAEEEDAPELDTDIIETDERHFPLTLAELGMIEGLYPEHLHGFVENGEFHPGLEELVTVWSQLELKDEPVEEDPFDGSPLGQKSGSAADDAADDAGDEDDDLPTSAEPTNDGRVNVNLAPLAVLRALAPDDIPTAFLEKVVEFRERVLDVRAQLDQRAREGLEGTTSSFFDDPDDEDSEGDSGRKDPEDEDDPTRFVFQSETEVFDKVEEELELSVFTDDEDKNEFLGRLGVTSQVFTIKVLIHDRERGRRSSYRTIVWRMGTPDGPRAVTLLPLEEYYDPRRLADISESLEDLSEERFERAERRLRP